MSTALFRICVTFPDIQIVYQSLCRWVWQVCSTSGIIPSFFNSFHHVRTVLLHQSFSSVLTWLARWIISPTLFPNVVFGQTFGCVRRWPVRFLFFNVRWATLQAGQGWHETLPASLINGTGCFHNEETVWKCFRWEPMMAMNSDFYISVVQLRCWVFVLFCLALVFVLLVRKVNEWHDTLTLWYPMSWIISGGVFFYTLSWSHDLFDTFWSSCSILMRLLAWGQNGSWTKK